MIANMSGVVREIRRPFGYPAEAEVTTVLALENHVEFTSFEVPIKVPSSALPKIGDAVFVTVSW